MKKLLALILAAVMLLTLAACGGKTGGEEPKEPAGTTAAPKADLETVEVTCEPAGVEEPAKVTLSYPKTMTKKVNDWNVELSLEEKDILVEVYFVNEYDCYDVNKEYAKEEGYEGYTEKKFGDFDGYYYVTDSGNNVEAFVYIDCVAEMDDVYLNFTIGSASRSLDVDPMELFNTEEVQTILSSAVYTAPPVPTE